MKKALTFIGASILFASQAFATYYVVMKDGSRYEAKAKPSVAGGKATMSLSNGGVVTVDAAAIDFPKSEQATRLGGGQLLGVELQAPPPPKQTSPLGSQVRMRQRAQAQTAAKVAPPPVADASTAAPAPFSGPTLGADVSEKFERAFENVGVFEHKMTPTGPRSLRADLTVDSEEKMFNTLSAAAFLIVRNAGIPGVQIDEIEMFMKMTNGGTSGRFKMTRDDAQALDSKQITREEYFVRKVLF